MIRSLLSPTWEVRREAGRVIVTFRVPASKFGPVEVRLSHDEADALGTRLTVESEEEEAL